VTRLANRRLFGERLAQFIEAARREGRKLAVVVLELDRIATLNDSLGRSTGDALVAQVAERLVKWSSDATRFARVGTERLAIALTCVNESDVARALEGLMRECMSPPFNLEGSEFRLAARAGIAFYPDDAADAVTLLRNAQAAASRARTAESHSSSMRSR
jgi:diguanylate cyclase (GGDEF)-like protein